MGKGWNIFYGIALIYLAVDAFFLSFIPSDLARALLVILVGALIMWTAHGKGRRSRGIFQQSQHSEESAFQWIRRWIFGGFVLFMGLISLLIDLGNLPRSMETLSFISLEMWGGQLILVAIGLIYLVSLSRGAREEDIISRLRPSAD